MIFLIIILWVIGLSFILLLFIRGNFNMFMQNSEEKFDFLDIGHTGKIIDFLPKLNNTLSYDISINDHSINILHILPESLGKVKQTKNSFIKSLSFKHPIIIYIRGLLFTKLFYYRVGLYEVLQMSNYHIISFDYTEEFPDTITKDGSLLDVITVYEYFNKVAQNSNIILWGHSLGSSVTLNLLNVLEDTFPIAIILENPFNSFNDLSPVKQFILDFVIEQDMVSDTIKKNIPILIIHSTYDYIVPFESVIDLFHIIKLRNKKVYLAIFDEFVINGHTDIYKIEQMPTVVNKFIFASINEKF